MAGPIHVLLPPCAHHLASMVAECGCVPVLDATLSRPSEVPDGAWVRIRPGQPAPGGGPVILAEDGAPVLDRETWLETAAVQEIPQGFAGVVLRGTEAAGAGGEQGALELLGTHPEPGRVLLDGGLGPLTTAAAAALGAAGVLVCGPLLALPELGLPLPLRRRLDAPDDELTHQVGGLRVGNPVVSPVVRELVRGADPWRLARQSWQGADLREALWLIDQGAALATGIAESYGTLPRALAAYLSAWESWGINATAARASTLAREVGSGAALQAPGTVAGPGGSVGIGVLWELAARLDRPIRGPLQAAIATGLSVAADPEAFGQARAELLSRAESRGLPLTAREPVQTTSSAAQSVEPAPDPVPGSAPAPASSAEIPPLDEPIAIIGMGCKLPGANDLATFWENLRNGVNAIIEVPPDRWSVDKYYHDNPSVPDKTYAKIGGFLQGFRFDNKRFRVPPRVVDSIDPVQQITLHAVDDALRDAGLQADPRRDEGKTFDRERCAVILGNSLGGEIKDDYALRVAWPEIAAHLRASPTFARLSERERAERLDELHRAYTANLPVITEDSMPGELSNVIAGRVANAFDLRGANFTADAACASSLAAIQAAVHGLQRGDFDLAVTGGADRSMNPSTYVKFCKIGALSPDRSTPFDRGANGFVMGEGVGILVLKRLRDAAADGDRVYAVIRGIGASSDGRGKGITAPNPRGQELALERAYQEAQIDPATVDLIEAHGTSTSVGDGVELTTLSGFIGSGKRGDRGPVRVGSVKSMIGHLKSAAGAAAMIKAALAVHHAVLPPSLGFREARPDVDLSAVPLQVQTRAEPWPGSPGEPRRAGISAFGFGGTNFHVVIESWGGRPPPATRRAPRGTAPLPLPAPPNVAAPPSSSEIVMAERPLPSGLWATSALDRAGLIRNLHRLRQGQAVPFHPSDPLRIAAAARDADERNTQIERALRVIEREQNPELLRPRNVYFEDSPVDGKVAFVFTGQGSQYLDMGLDLARDYPLVQATFDEADQIVKPALGKGITEYIRSRPDTDREAQEYDLQRTEISQPATLAVDVAILRLLSSYGVYPDMVAGHSLGEYAACVAAGVMTFEQALLAVSARGKEMAAIRIDDPGKMAGVAAPTEVVEELLAEIDGYVIAANKNCPTQTVIAGASDAVDEAVERFQARGLTVYRLPVSHAFHSQIVAPATEPLKGVLRQLGLSEPRRPITTNVTSDYYPTGPEAVDQVIEILGEQISAPVEWTSQVDRMYADGARLFIECGPKRALTGFVVSILKRRPHRAFYTNHPKRGGDWSFRDALAGLLVAGMPVKAEPSTELPDLFATPAPRTATTEAVTARMALVEQATEAIPDVTTGILKIVAAKTGYDPADLDLEYELEADLGIDTVKQAEIFAVVRETYGIPPDPGFSFAEHRRLRSVIDWAAARIGATRPQVPEPEPAPFAATDAVQGFLVEAARAGLHGLDAESFARALLPSVQGLIQAAFNAAQGPVVAPAPPPPRAAPAPRAADPGRASEPTEPAPASEPPAPAPVATPPPPQTPAVPREAIPSAPAPSSRPTAWPQVVCTGASVGLPGDGEVFGADNLDRLLKGDNRITALGERTEHFLDMNIVRLRKDPTTGSGTFALVTDRSDVIKLAGQAGSFDLTEWGVPENLIEAFDITTQLAMAAAFEALRDAGIPLVRTTKLTASGKEVPTGWALPEPLRDETGVIFASAFPGYDQLVQQVQQHASEPGRPFDRRFLFQILAMGHSQIAQAIGARGPNTQVNAACASPAQATAIAHDWIRLGRCRRVLVVSADNVTGEALLPWIGGGFLAAGAASIAENPEDAALPFDARRHGLVLGMGAHGMVLETAQAAAERGVVPIAELLNSTFVNSAFHGTRLHPTHIREVVQQAVSETCAALEITPQDFARDGLFMSHETYTPARGGSAQAEIEALRSAFGEAAGEITIANTKGYTGHPMSAGIEDTITVKVLQYGRIPPIANFRDPDPELGDLRLARGEDRRLRYALRLAAGFGSQLACTLWRAIAFDDDREDTEVRRAWLRRVTGFDGVREVVEQRTLRVLPDGQDQLVPMVPQVSPAAGRPKAERTSSAPTPSPAAQARIAPSVAEILDELTALVAQKTGYEPSEIEPDFELEADLGIDTVKQAEIFSEIRDRHGLERDDSFSLADHPTVEALAAWLAGAIAAGAGSTPAPSPSPGPAPAPAPAEPSASEPIPLPPATPAATSLSTQEIFDELTALVAQKTGYEPSEIEPDFELEADLGIDTVKQAEIFSEIRDRHGLERDDSFSLADHPTVEALAAWLAGAIAASAGSAPAPSPSPGPAPAPAPAEPSASEPIPLPPATPAVTSLSTQEILDELTALVAQKTGYEPSEIEPDFELEADLGIDTVKQAEIFSEIRDRHGLERDDSFSLADHPTVEALAAWLAGAIEGQRSSPAPSGEAPSNLEPDLFVEDELLVENDLSVDPVTPEPAPAAPAAETQPRRAEPARTTKAEAPLRLEPPPHVERQPPATAPLPATFRVRTPILVPAPASSSGALTGEIVHVIGPELLVDAISRAAAYRGARLGEDATIIVDVSKRPLHSFGVARAYDQRPPKRWVAVTTLGGLDPQGHDPTAAVWDGARAGFAKALGREWSETHAQVLDLPPGLSTEALAEAIVEELNTPSRSTEVFRSGKVRRTIGYSTVPSPPTGVLRPGAVVLLTGGGRGITARVGLELARRGPVVLVVVGRGPAAVEPLNLDAEKESIRNALRATGARVTPAEIERRLAPLRRNEELRSNLEAMRQAGALVEYHRLDLSDTAGIGALVQSVISRHGHLDVCVHGAGVEESRLIRDKDDAGFSRVFDGKALGGLSLVQALPPETTFVSMGSVAGRFGNAGQVDYSAANDALARMVAARGNALHLDWTAWDDVGMAVRGGMRRLLTDRGVDLLPADAGAGLLADLIAAGATGELIVAGRLGDFLPAPEHPLLDRVDLDGEDAFATSTLSLIDHPWLHDHAIAGTVVLPGVIGLELMAAVAALTEPGQAYAGARGVRFLQAAKFHHGEPLSLSLTATHGKDATARCTLASTRTLRTGRQVEVEHFEATLQLGFVPELEGLPSAFFPDETYDHAAIYTRFFHGPAFRVLREVQGVAQDGLVAEAVIDHSKLPEGLQTEPLLLEAAFQAAGFHHMIVHDEMALPSSIQELQLLGTCRPGQRVSIMVRRRGEVYDVDITSSTGPLLRLRGFKMATLGPLDPAQRFPPPEWERPTVFQADEDQGAPDGHLARAVLHEDPSPWLSPEEIEELGARGTSRRIADRLAGRIAAKRALSALTGVSPDQIRVETAPSGAPLARVPGFPHAQVSITHRDGLALAYATHRTTAGIDLETIEPRPAAFTQDWFRAGELPLLPPGALGATLGWAIKESVLKALGVGMAVHPREIEIVALHGTRASVRLRGRAAILHAQAGGPPIEVNWSRVGQEQVLVRATFAA